MRELSFTEAIQWAQDEILAHIPGAFIIGEGVTDPKAVFGTCAGLAEKYPGRVFDSPVSEAGVTGVCIGAAIAGMRPIHVHQRMDFSMYAMDQIVNNMAKWHSMFGFQRRIPMVIRMTVGRGWGAGNQHAQNLEALFTHIPGLQVVVPYDAESAYRLLINSVLDMEPTIFIEHKWLHNIKSKFEPKFFPVTRPAIYGWPDCKVIPGKDLTIVAWGPSAELAREAGAQSGAEIILLQRLTPFNPAEILLSVQQTKRLLVLSDAWRTGGFASEIIASVVENMPGIGCKRITFSDTYVPSSHLLSKYYYTTLQEVMDVVGIMTDRKFPQQPVITIPHDVDPRIGKVISAI